MATLSGLKLLQKSVALHTALRLGNRNRRIPKRIVYYSRFAAQLNFLRWSDRLSVRQIVNDDIERTDEDLDLNQLNLDLPPEQTKDNVSSQTNRPSDERERVPRAALEIHKLLFASQFEYSENDYIYRHIHRRLDKFANLGELLNSLPINLYIKKLKIAIQENKSEEVKAELLDTLKELIHSMNQQELAILLTAIKNLDQDEFKKVKRMIDIELRWLLKKHVKTRLMDLDLWLYLADIFYECLMKSTFVHVLVNYMSKENEITMTNSQFLHLLFLVVLQRRHNGLLTNYEERIRQVLNKASFEDVALICMAYFKTKTQIKNTEVLRQIINKIVEHLSSIDPKQPGYCSIIKAIRYSRNIECRQDVVHLVMTLVEDLDCKVILASAYNAIHTIKLMESYRIYDAKLLDHVANIMFENLDEFRIKDIQYTLTTLSNFGYKDLELDTDMKRKFDQICTSIVSESRDDVEQQRYHLLPLLRALSMYGYYNDKLIKYANQLLSDPSIVTRMSEVLEFDKSALLVYVASRIEGGKEKLGHRGDFFKKISKSINRAGNLGSVRQDSSLRHLDFILRSSLVNETQLLVISKRYREIAKALASSEHLKDPAYRMAFQYTMPHQNFADLVITREKNEPGAFDAETLMPRKVPDGQKHCLLYLATKHDYVDGYNRMSGYKRLVARLLTKLGYNLVLVDYDEPDIDNLARKIKLTLDNDQKGDSTL